MKVGSILATLVFMIFAAVLLNLSFRFGAGVGGDVGPGFFPRAISIMILVCGVIIIVSELRKNSPELLLSTYFKKSAAMGFTTFAYIYLINPLGFVIATPLFVFGFLFILKQRNYLLNAFFALTLTAVVYAIFRMWLNVRLAVSFLGF